MDKLVPRRDSKKIRKKNHKVSVSIVKQLLKKYNFRRRKALKMVSGQENIKNRDEQFKNIEKLKEQYEAEGDKVQLQFCSCMLFDSCLP